MKQLNEYETPNTNCCSFTVQIDGKNASVVGKPVCADLERKLAMCRDALAAVVSSNAYLANTNAGFCESGPVMTQVRKALDQTK